MDDLPGVIKTRQVVEDLSDDEEDFGTFAFLKSGKDKKVALQEMERRKHEKVQQANVGAAEEAAAASAAAAAQKPSPSPRAGSKRPRRGAAKGKQPEPEDLEEPVELDEADRALVQRHAEQNERMRQAQDRLRGLDDDDDDDDVIDVEASSRAGPSSSFQQKNIWLLVAAEPGSKEVPMRVEADQPLSAKLVGQVAAKRGCLPERLMLLVDGRQLDVSRTPQQLGLAERQSVQVEEAEPPKGITLKLVQSGKAEPLKLTHPPDGTFDELLRAFCQKRGLEPRQYQLMCDGDVLAPKQTPNDLDLEDGDQLEVGRPKG